MKKNLLYSSMIGAISIVLGVASASASILTSASNQPPDAAISLVRSAVPDNELGTSYMMRYYNNYATGTNRRREIGQSFLVPGETPVDIDGFVLRINDGQNLSGVAKNFTLTIYEAATNGVPVGAAIYQSTGTLPSEMSNLQYITFLLDQTVTLEAGTRYSFQLGYTTSSGVAQISFAASNSNLYPEGRSFYYANSDSGNLASMIYTPALRDMDFAVLYTPVPEGGTAALLMISLVVIGGRQLIMKRRGGLLQNGEAV